MKRLPTTVFLVLLAACARVRPTPAPRSPLTRDQYETEVLRSDLGSSKAYTEWSNAAHHALRDRLGIKPSFKEILSFPADRAAAVGYRLELRRGQRLHIDLERTTSGRIFTEVFEEIGPGEPIFRLVQSARGFDSHMTFEATSDGPHVIRLQPELFKGGEVTVTVTTTASLTFPVLGKTSRAIGSVFGDARDGGERQHEGIDIFAPAGTDVIAAADGIISSVAVTPLGGNVVWEDDPVRNVSYYYAHLKTQNVRRGDRVAAGQLVGTVGNTGNARTTPSHLHFGVYKPGRHAIDPVPFLFDQPGNVIQPILADLAALGSDRRLATGRNAYLLGAVGDRYRVLFSDGTQGFQSARDVPADFTSTKAAH